MPIRPKTLLNLVGTALLIAYVAYSADLLSAEGRQELLRVVRGVSPWLIAASIAVGLLTNIVATLKWRVLLRARGLRVDAARLFGLYMASKPFNLLLPSGAGGDAMRIHAVGSRTHGYSDAAAAVVVDRLIGLTTVLALAAGALLANLGLFDAWWLVLGVALWAATLAAAVWLIVDERALAWLRGRGPARKGQRWLARALDSLERVQQAVASYREQRRALALAILGALIFDLLIMTNIMIGVRAFAPETALLPVLMVAPVTLFMVNLPVAIGGAGPAELAYGFPLGLVGVAPAVALSAALLLRVRALLDAAIGALCFLITRTDRPAAPRVPGSSPASRRSAR
jgi:glycosyltransferase 2 family protein